MKLITVLVAASSLFISLTAFSPAPVKKAINSGFSVKSTAQTDFAFFRAHRQGKAGVALTWSITDETGVTGFIVERSYNFYDPTDEWSYETVHSVPCNGARSYKCDDENVYPGTILYRVKAIMEDGSVVTSDIDQVRIVQRK